MRIVDFSPCAYSNRHGTYGGMAGDKDGIIYQDACWIVKYPKSTRGLKQSEGLAPYTTSPLSEFIGSNIYGILGFDVHRTILGKRNGKLVVACKDFCVARGQLTEMRTIKNAANRELSELLDTDFHNSATGDRVNLEELLLHFQHNPLLKDREDVRKRFWICAVVDILIDNNDRNNGNWGLLYHEDDSSYTLAPVYDNGNSFMNKADEMQISKYLEDGLLTRAIGSRTAYEYNGHTLSAKKFLDFPDEDLKAAILSVVPLIKSKFGNIKDFLYAIPETYDGLSVCSEARKKCYLRCMEYRLEQLLVPAYDRCMSERNRNASGMGDEEPADCERMDDVRLNLY